jgi:hypothetical protein
MPKKYVRKTKPLAESAENALLKWLDQRGGQDDRPKGRLRALTPDNIGQSFDRLAEWLREFQKEAYRRGASSIRPPDPLAFSALLQIWLDAWGIAWPREVFVQDLASPGRGRPNKSNLGWKARFLYKPKVFGWKKVARKLIPEEYDANPNRAANKVRHAFEAEERLSPLESPLRVTGYKMLGRTLPSDMDDPLDEETEDYEENEDYE